MLDRAPASVNSTQLSKLGGIASVGLYDREQLFQLVANTLEESTPPAHPVNVP
jgi:hypothetical protein